ncbi:MAG: O-antigen ligase family protein [Verrucomicrobiota bacterium]
MIGGRNGHGDRHGGEKIHIPDETSSRHVFGSFWALLLGGTLLVAAPWAGYHAVMLGCVGLLMWLCPPVLALPRLWWILAAIFVVAGAAAFLPASWFGVPEWRRQLAALGVDTGALGVIQVRHAAEAYGMFAITLVGGLWLAGHRPSPEQARQWALAFSVGVAGYAVLARFLQPTPHPGSSGGEELFGFFPNRNHTATYLAMGAICSLGNVLQALRDKRFLALSVALVAASVCLWALAAWSLSRGGVVLVAIGGLAWLPMLGPRYLGKHGLWALGLIALATTGLFFITESGVKERISKTMEQASVTINSAEPLPAEQKKPAMDAATGLDLRIPITLDTLDLIRAFKWTGIGAGQFFYIFPQYRNLSAAVNNLDSFHPESDWLWMAAETGVPATLALAALVIAAFWKARTAILGGRDRALRSACLVAALLMPIHGLFDVPGHRLPLAWSAAFLFTLALHGPSHRPSHGPSLALLPAAPRVWPFRLVALCLLALASWLALTQWGGAPQPAQVAASSALQQAHDLYQQDDALEKAALAEHRSYKPAPADDLLIKALGILAQAAPLAPLNSDLLRYQAYLAMNFNEKFAFAAHCYALELALNPSMVDGPLYQSQVWIPHEPQRCAALWREALRRAAWLDGLQTGTHHSHEQTLQLIRQLAKGKPELEKLVPLPE